MSHPRFEGLRETLLRAGIAPRHVRRYIDELRQHFDDLIAEENTAGISGAAAEQAACARLGGNDELAAAMQDRPELRSISARYPWAVFGIMPILTLGVSLFVATLIQIGLLKLHMALTHSAGGVPPVWMQSAFVIWDATKMYVFPLLIAAALCFIGMRQRTKIGWIALSTLTTLVLGATFICSATWSNLPHQSQMDASIEITSDSLPRVYVSLALGIFIPVLQWWLTRRRIVAE